MTIALIFQAIIAALKFPEAMSAFLTLIEKTPEEKRDDIAKQVNAWMEESSTSERPKWEN